MTEPLEGGLSFRPLAEADLELVARWLSAEHVRRWWWDPSDIESVRAKYLPRIRGTEPTEVFVVGVDGLSVGLIQRYRFKAYGTWAATVADSGLAYPDAAGIDYVIGEPDATGRGLGTAMIASFTTKLFDEMGDVATVVVTPQADNIASCRALRNAGYQHVWTGRLDSDDPADAGLAGIYVRHRVAV